MCSWCYYDVQIIFFVPHRAPQFCFFSTVHRYQVLVLMINQRCRLPSSATRDFVSKVKERIFGDPWCAFLLHRLELDVSHDMKHCCQMGRPALLETVKFIPFQEWVLHYRLLCCREYEALLKLYLWLQAQATVTRTPLRIRVLIHSLQLKSVGVEPQFWVL